MAKTKEDIPWKHMIVDTVEVEGSTTLWKAQKSIAPDGKKFVGIRKFVVKKDGTEQVTATGISVSYSKDGSHKAEIESLIRLLGHFV